MPSSSPGVKYIPTDHDNHIDSVAGMHGFVLVTVPYSASMTFDATAGNVFVITATNGTAFTINAPTATSANLIGRRITVRIRNTSGGAAGTATWNSAFKMATWTQPATANSRAIDFIYDGANWVEASRTASDVPN